MATTTSTTLPRFYTFQVYTEDLTPDFPFEAVVRYCERFTDEFALIVHKPESGDKKEHIHVLAYNAGKRKAESLQRLPSAVAYRSWQPVKHPADFAHYMLHDTAQAKKDNKTPYLRDAVVCSSDEWFDGLLAGEVASPDDEKVAKALDLLDDALAFGRGEISLRTFISCHPEAVYKMGQIKTLIEMSCASSFDVEDYSHVVQQRDIATNRLRQMEEGARSLYGDDAVPMICNAGKEALRK